MHERGGDHGGIGQPGFSGSTSMLSRHFARYFLYAFAISIRASLTASDSEPSRNWAA